MTEEMEILENDIQVLVLDADTTTPDVIEGWLQEGDEGRELMKEMLATMKTYATLESHAAWYTWRRKLVQNTQTATDADATALREVCFHCSLVDVDGCS